MKKNQFLLAFIFISCTIFFNCSSVTEDKSSVTENKDTDRFYDFDFAIKLYDERVGLYEEFTFKDSELPSDTYEIRHIRFYTEDMEKISKPDTLMIPVSKSRLDSIYQTMVSKLTPTFKSNVRKPGVQPPPYWDNEWVHCDIMLHLQYEDTYHVRTQVYQDLTKMITR